MTTEPRIVFDRQEILESIVNPHGTCFLCFQRHETTFDVFEKLELHGPGISKTLSLYSIMDELFSAYEILHEQICERCSNLVLEFYVLIERNKLRMRSILGLINQMDSKIEQNAVYTGGDKYTIDLRPHNDINDEKVPASCDPTMPEKEEPRNKTILKKQKAKPKARVCDICSKICPTSRALSIHRKGHESKPCPYCNKILKTHQHFNVHIRNHETGQRRKNASKTVYECNECKYKTCNKQTLAAHINRKHLNLRPFVCKICCKGFFKKSHVTEHFRTVHSDAKSDTCEICGESFGRKRSLIEHLKLHSGEKPYSCGICGYAFVTAGRRNTHVKRKHEERQMVCDICGLAFSLGTDLARHKRSVHLLQDLMSYN